MKLKLILFFLFISNTVLYSTDIKFYSINSIHGISMRETFSVCKDENGFVWSSSKTGVLRLAENAYRIYQPPYKTVDITFLKLVYKNSSLIAYTNNGQIFIYNELFDRFDLLTDLRELSDDNYVTISGIAIDDTGMFWIASSKGLYKYKDGSLLIVEGRENFGYYISLLDHKHLYYADKNEMILLDIETSDYEVIYKNPPENTIQVSSSYYDENIGLLWIGTFSHGLYQYDFNKKELVGISEKGIPKQPILAIKENTYSSLLLGIDGQGIWELKKEDNTVMNIYKEDINNPFSLRGDGVYDIYSDDNKRVWITTYTGGLSFFEQDFTLVNHITHRINNLNSLGNNEVHQIIEDRKGDIWFATDNGISRWNPSINQWDVFYHNEQEQAQVFLTLCEDNHGNIWGGTYSSGIYILDKESRRKIHHYSGENQNPDEPGKFIFDIFKDSQGDIWIGGVDNVLCYLWKENRFRSYPVKPVNSFSELAPGQILATYSHGLVLLDKESGYIERLVGGCLAHDVVAIDHHIWLATSGNGLVLYNYSDDTKTWFTTDSGLSSNYVNSIMYADDYLWIGTENGLCQLDISDNKITTCSFIFSLSNLSFNVNSCRQLKNGDLIWGTNNGAVMFSPDKIYHNSPEGRIFFQDIIVSGRSIRENQDLIKNVPIDKKSDITLKYNQNTLSLELLSIGTSSGYSKYSWKMDGLDTEWSPPSSLSIINYANLPGGKFLLSVRMYDNSMTHIIDERTLAIHIIPPFWKTGWFRFFVAVIIIGTIVYSLRAYSNHLKQKNAKEKIRFFTNMAHDIRTSLTLISAPIEQMDGAEISGKARYYLNLATEQSKRLTTVVTQLLDFEKVDSGKGQLFPVMTDIVLLVSNRCRIFETTAVKKDIKLVFHTDSQSFFTGIDEIKIEKVIDNLLSNAIKYSHTGSYIEIILTCGKDKWILEVKDYGLGISAHAKEKLFKEFYRGDNKANSRIVGSGIGLLLVKNYVEMHGGKIEFDSEVNVGSSFKISLPYIHTNEAVTLSALPAPENMPNPVQNNANSVVELDNSYSKDRITRLLVVEDNTDLQDFLVKSLEDNYKISTANDGFEAWNIIQKETFDLIISDIMMPKMDGFELCTKIKSTFETSHIPVILLTSLSQKAKQLEGLGLGADDYITKPFDISLLLQRISTIIKNREAIRKKAFKLMNQTGQDNQVYTNELNDKFVKKALEVVRNNMANTKFGKEEFAADMNVSPSLLFQKLKSLTEQSPLDFIRSVRFNHAMELLQSQKYSITEISEMCGFSSPNYFSTAFKKHYGKSPLEVQNEKKKASV